MNDQSQKSGRGEAMRKIDEADEIAEMIFDMVRDSRPDQDVINVIASELRKAAQGPRKWGVLR